ncbi:MAG TPA: FtsX-like permease family protein [Vicinamibacterales bacterium]|nr:FtsX-like permease family protein [Vicinamibacterales bacterium]
MIARRAYRVALLAFPERHRRNYRHEMIAAFDHELSSRKNILSALVFTVTACADAVAAGVAERRRDRRWRLGAACSTLDVVLAWRMLLRYPGLSIVGAFSIAVGIAIAAGAYAVTSAMSNPTVPLDEGDRVVSLMQWDVSTSNRERRMVYDFLAWRSLTSIDGLSITRTVQRNLMVAGRTPEIVTVAEISAAAFRVARVPAHRGRFLLSEDEAPGAQDALVIGYDEWVRRFGSDPDVVGRRVQLGSTTHTIVGVMPDGFVFPLHHGYWIPWRIDAAAYEPRSGPQVNVFGRLAAGATMESAQAELNTFSERIAAATPATHQHLRPRVLPYPHAYNEMDDPENVLVLQAMQAAIVLLLVLVCVNVAILVYARTATRQGEIAVRGALGASRRRIVTQLFVEGLILAGIAAAAGVGLASVVLRQFQGQMLIVMGQALPFWMTLQLPPDGVLYIVALTLLAAGIIGVAPALKATGRPVHTGLQSLSAGSGSRMQMGRLWTTLIVAQVAVTVTVLPTALFLSWTALRFRTADPGFASSEFLTGQLLADRATEPPTAAGERAFTRKLALIHGELDRRLREESRVGEVTFSMAGVGEERAMVLEIDGRDAPIDAVDYNIVEGSRRGHLVRFNRVAINFFEAYEVPVIMGRALSSSDTGTNAMESVLVNRALVDFAFDGANPLGSRIRYVGRSREADERDVVLDRWYEIVGVVPDFPTLSSAVAERESKVYHAAAFGDVYPVELAVRIRGADPMMFAGTFREISAAVDPNLQLRDIATAEIVLKREQGFMRLLAVMVIIVMLSVVGLAAAGMYALMSFTVSRRRREIGIRAALGADRRRLLAGIFARALAQLGAGAAAGLFGAIGLAQMVEGDMFDGRGVVLLPIVIATMTLVGLLAAVGPARRGLSIQPTEALREE